MPKYWNALICLVVLVLFERAGLAGVNVIGQLPSLHNDSYDGLAFDGGSNPLILQGFSWTLDRVDKTNAAILSSQAINAAADFNNQMVFDPTSGDYFTIGTASNQASLVRINSATLQAAVVGPLNTAQINFAGLAVDSSGKLWLGMDSGGTKLYSIDKSTGAATLAFSVPYSFNNVQLHTMTIASNGTFFIAAASISSGGEQIYKLNPNSGAVSFVTTTAITSNNPYLVAIDQDPSTSRYYGLQRNVNTFSLVEVTGVPEPDGGMLLAILLALRYRRRAR